MARKSKLLGPDGKPLDVSKYRPQPTVIKVKSAEMTIKDNVSVAPRTGRSWFDSYFTNVYTFSIGGDAKPDKAELRSAIEAQLDAIHADLSDMETAPAECPPLPAEVMDTYDAAWSSAVRNCEHEGLSRSTTYASHEYQCMDCGRYYTRAPRGMFG